MLRPLSSVIGLALTTACTSQIVQEASASKQHGRLVAVQPADGAMAVRGAVTVDIALGEYARNVTPKIELDAGAKVFTPPCLLGDDGLLATCKPIDDLPPDTPFDLTITLGKDEPVMVSGTTEAPSQGTAWLLNRNSEVTRLGGDDSAAATLGDLLRSSDTVGLLLDSPASQPIETTFLAGPATAVPDEPVSIDEPGLTFAMPVQLEIDGRFHSDPTDLFLPIFVDTEIVQVLVRDCVVHGTLNDDETLSHFAISGKIPASSLLHLAEPLGPLGSLVLSRVQLDVDTDGDGTDDAASFKLVSPTAEPVKLRAFE